MFNRLSTNTPNSKKNISNIELSLFNNVVCLAEQGQESHQTKVTFNLTDAAADKLLGLAEAGDDALRELGIGSLQIEGGQVIFTILLSVSISITSFYNIVKCCHAEMKWFHSSK